MMLLAFSSSAAMLISVLATFFTGLIVMVKHQDFGVPIPLGIALIILSAVGFVTLITSVPKLYTETVKRCNDDINGFVREQKGIAKRSFGNPATKVRMNLIFGLIAYERFEEAESVLMRVAPSVENHKKPLYRLNYLLYMLDVYKNRHDYDSYSYTMERLLNEIQSNPYLFPLERVEYENLAEINRLETAFFTRTPEQLANNDQEIAQQLNFLARMYLSQEHFSELWSDYLCMHFNYILGVTYAVMGDDRSADFYFGTVASQPFTYPEAVRTREYLQTKDIKIFF